MNQLFFKKYIGLILSTATVYLLVTFLFGLLAYIPAIGNRFKNSIDFSGAGIIIPILLLVFLFLGNFALARSWAAKEKAGVDTLRWQSTLRHLVAIGLAIITFIYVSFFFAVATSHTTNFHSNNIPIYQKYPVIIWVAYLMCVLPSLLVIIPKTRKMGARWCLVISTAIILRMLFQVNASSSAGSYLLFGCYLVPAAILLMFEKKPSVFYGK
jgi:hypothetical protein